MKPAAIIRHVPKTLAEAVKILGEVAPQDGRVRAGGQSLVPIMAFRLAKPAHLVDINEVEGLDAIRSDGKTLSIGARVRHGAFHNAVAAGPLGATMIAASTRGERRIAAKDFFAGIMSTALAEDELLARVELPLLPPGTRFGFNEFNRRAGDFAMSAALVTYRLDGGKIVDAKAGVGGAETHPRRIPEAEAMLHGKAPGDAVFRAAAEAATNAIEALEDHQTSAEYRRDLVRAVVRRALESANA